MPFKSFFLFFGWESYQRNAVTLSQRKEDELQPFFLLCSHQFLATYVQVDKKYRTWKYAELTSFRENKYRKLPTNVMHQQNVQSGPSPRCLNSKQQPAKWKKQSIRPDSTRLEFSNKENIRNWEHLLLTPFEKEGRVVPSYLRHKIVWLQRQWNAKEDGSMGPAKAYSRTTSP